jgi:hypothetical protein
VLAQNYVNLLNAQAEGNQARNYHNELVAFAAGKGGR